jgi:hypothetical protein
MAIISCHPASTILERETDWLKIFRKAKPKKSRHFVMTGQIDFMPYRTMAAASRLKKIVIAIVANTADLSGLDLISTTSVDHAVSHLFPLTVLISLSNRPFDYFRAKQHKIPTNPSPRTPILSRYQLRSLFR